MNDDNRVYKITAWQKAAASTAAATAAPSTPRKTKVTSNRKDARSWKTRSKTPIQNSMKRGKLKRIQINTERMLAESASRAPAGSLSRWWETESAKLAFRRAEARKREAIEKMKANFAARKELLAREADEWQQVSI